MRLTCPNCDAQYEIPEDVLPPEGREVQCSSCGTTWFQAHPGNPDAAAAESVSEPQEDEEIARFDEPEQPEAAEPPKKPDAPEAPEIKPAPKRPSDEPAPARRELDPSVADVLRAEAELEEQARRHEMASMESQPELGLDAATDDAEHRAQQARNRMARMRGEPAPSQEATVDTTQGDGLGSRRDLLPDIEEINSTLRSNSDRSPESDPGQTAQIEVQEKRSSIRGFTLSAILIAVLALVYVFAAELSDAAPQIAGYLDSYVSMIDGWRAWLDGKVVAMLSWLDAAAASSSQ